MCDIQFRKKLVQAFPIKQRLRIFVCVHPWIFSTYGWFSKIYLIELFFGRVWKEVSITYYLKIEYIYFKRVYYIGIILWISYCKGNEDRKDRATLKWQSKMITYSGNIWYIILYSIVLIMPGNLSFQHFTVKVN